MTKLFIGLSLTVISFGQAAFPTTSLTSATSQKSWFPLVVASAANIFSYWSQRTIIVVDQEAMCVNLVIGTYVYASRGCQGSATQNHANGATVYAGRPSDFHNLPPGVPGGQCTATRYPVLPYIVLPVGGGASKWNCTGGVWVVN